MLPRDGLRRGLVKWARAQDPPRPWNETKVFGFAAQRGHINVATSGSIAVRVCTPRPIKTPLTPLNLGR